MKNEEDQILRKHFTDLARKADQSHIATFTGFLSLPEQSVFYSMDFSYVPYCVFGGQEGCERAVIRFGEEWEFPICCIKMAPLMNKFADALTHRDFLGALIGAGISRENIGDICVGKGSCDFFVTASVAPFLLQSFTGAGRTHLHLEKVPLTQVQVPDPEIKEIRDTLASLRLDSVISAGFRIGRSLASTYVTAGKAAIDGLPCEKPDKMVSEGAKISVRGLGKIKLAKINGTTKKDRISVVIHQYV